MGATSTRFWLCVGSPTCQDLLKHEVLSRHPELKFAFSRPGLLTFKADRELTVKAAIESRLATLCGPSLGGAKSVEEIAALTRKVGPSSVDVFAWPVDEEQEAASATELGAVEEAVRGELEPAGGDSDLKLGILVPPPSRKDDGYWVFLRAAGWEAPTARVTPPPTSPSRAYSKLVEALAHFRLSLRAGDGVLELGAAPGGATLALIERGLSVVAVDPAEMDPSLAPLAQERGVRLRHLQKPAQALDAKDLAGFPAPVRWLVSDMNLAPPVAVQQLLRARALVKKTLHGAVLTLKLNDAAAVDTLPRVLPELERAFGVSAKVAHLPSHRREVVAVLV